MRLEKAGVIRLLHDQPAFSELLLHHLLSRNIRIEEDLVDQLFNSSEKRLARVLLLLANFGKEGKPEPVIPKISQETLAEIVGTTRSQSQLFHEPVPQTGLHPIQRPDYMAAWKFIALCSTSSCTTEPGTAPPSHFEYVSNSEQTAQGKSPILYFSPPCGWERTVSADHLPEALHAAEGCRP